MTLLANTRRSNMSLSKLAAISYLAVVLTQISSWGNEFIPVHDTANILWNFHFIYSNFIQYGDFPYWNPFTNFGFLYGYWLITVNDPASFAIMQFGSWFGVRNVLTLFRLSILADTCVLAFGMLLLCRDLRLNWQITLAVTIAAAAAVLWHTQIFYNLRLFYLIPLLLHLMWRTTRNSDSKAFYAAGNVALLSLLGNAIYLIPITATLYLVFFVSLYWASGHRLNQVGHFAKTIVVPHGAINWLLLATMLAGLAAYVGSIAAADSNVLTTPLLRDPYTNKVSFWHFFSYPGASAHHPHKYLELLTGFPQHPDNILYAGMLGVTFMLYGMFFTRWRGLPAGLGIATLLIALFTISSHSFLAAITWLVPGTEYFRHVGLMATIIKPIFFILAGIGMNVVARDWRLMAKPERSRIGWRLLCCALVVVGLRFALEAGQYYSDFADNYSLLHYRKLSNSVLGNFITVSSIALVAVAFGSLVVKRRVSHAIIIGALAFGWVIEMVTYNVIHVHALGLAGGDQTISEAMFQARDFRWQANRALSRADTKSADVAGAFMQRLGVTDFIFDAFMRTELCFADSRVDFITFDVDKMLRARAGLKPANSPEALYTAITRFKGYATPDKADAAMLRAAGCGAAKLRLVTGPTWLRTAEDGYAALGGKSSDYLDARPFILPVTGVHDDDIGAASDQAPEYPFGDVIVDTFGPNELIAKVEVAQSMGAWLYYADAYHPRWKAEVDGRPAPVYQANIGFKALPLRPGPHIVRFHIEPGPIRITLRLLTWLSVAFVLVVLTAPWWITAHRREDRSP